MNILSTDTKADFAVSMDIFELDYLVNKIHNYQDNPTSSFSTAVVTSLIALLIEKCENEGKEFKIYNLEGMIK